jgi:alkylation response protein AidB-like acyl-CoA dehydrogenase
MQADPSLVARARDVAQLVAPMLGELETERRLPAAAVDALVSAGIFKLCVPRAYGGAEADPVTCMAVVEELSRVDGSLGWCAMLGITSGLMAAYLDQAVAREIYGPADAISCGVFAPMGRAVATDGGYRVSGKWSFASGCEHSGWRMGGAIVTEPAELLPSGAPDVRCMLFHRDDTTIHDTWKTSGLRGTGSHDMSVRDVVVPRERTFSLLTGSPRIAGYELPFFGVLASGIGAVGVGIGRAAIDSASAVVRTKVAPGGKRPHSHREHVQIEVARAEARLRGARALLTEALAEAVQLVRAEAPADPRVVAGRARLRMAACHAAAESAAVTAAMFELGGGAAIYNDHPLQRQFRDAHVVTHHLMVSSTAMAMAGRVLLGVETDVTLL